MRNISLQYRNLVSPIAGLFGLSIQKKTNLLIRVIDELGNLMTGVTISYPNGGSTITFTTSATNDLYELSIAVSTTTTVTLSKIGYVTQEFNVTIAANDFMVLDKAMVLAIVPYKVIIRR